MIDVVIARLIAQNFPAVEMAGRSYERKKNDGLTVTVSSEPWCAVGGRVFYVRIVL